MSGHEREIEIERDRERERESRGAAKSAVDFAAPVRAPRTAVAADGAMPGDVSSLAAYSLYKWKYKEYKSTKSL